MDQQAFRQTIVVLSGEHSLSILRGLRDGDWHISSEVARALHIHISTASKFLQRFAELGLVERRPHDSRTFEYRLRNARLHLELDLEDDAGPLREVVDFYVAYFHSLFERIRFVGTPTIESEMEHRLTTDHQELRRAVFDQMVVGSDGGLDRLRELVAAVHRDLWTVCAQGLGASAAKGAFEGALRDAIGLHPDLAVRCGLSRALEG
ncbi:MAG TPA: helix-turn-helix domain-containing protein [Thermoplasmata archaeon]|nr:helix-turn-helix domain-containing protein [Thermoplasmata archaeon]